MEDKEIIGLKIKQHCGDILVVLKKSEKRSKNGVQLYECSFEGFEDIILFCEKRNILSCSVYNNYRFEKEFIDTIHPQNCGYNLKVIEKTNIRQNPNNTRSNFLYKCYFIENPDIILYTLKDRILHGTVLNPAIEENFQKTLWPFPQEEIIKILEKTNKQAKDGSFIYKCEFQKYPYIIYLSKSQIKDGNIINPQIEIEEFVKKEWKQDCGDILIIKEKLENSYFRCEFQKTKDIVVARKDHIKQGGVLNPGLEVNYSRGENELRQYIQELFPNEKIERVWNLIQNKEIDIYIPNLKIGIEFNGCFWHSTNPKYGVSNDYHLKKSLAAKEQGIQLIHIWEDEWKENKERIKVWLKNKLFGIEDKLFEGDLSKEPEKLFKDAIPIPIKRGEFICYNCGYAKDYINSN